MNSPVRLGVSPAAASTPQVFSLSGLRIYFPTLELLVGRSVTQSTSCCLASQTSSHNPPPLWVCQPPPRCPTVSPLHPGCLSPPLLLVWVNVSSLSPWLSDFHTVRFSVSSGCFLFLNCCCCSFGCVRRHSVSAYTSMVFCFFVLLLLSAPWPSCEGSDHQGRGRRHGLSLGLSVPNGQFHWDPQTLPVTSGFGDVIPSIFWRQAQGADLGG